MVFPETSRTYSISGSLLSLGIFIIIAFLNPSVSYGQSRRIAAAEEAFNNFQYNVAVNRYKKAYSKTKSRPEKDRISFQMAECYRMMNNTKRPKSRTAGL